MVSVDTSPSFYTPYIPQGLLPELFFSDFWAMTQVFSHLAQSFSDFWAMAQFFSHLAQSFFHFWAMVQFFSHLAQFFFHFWAIAQFFSHLAQSNQLKLVQNGHYPLLNTAHRSTHLTVQYITPTHRTF